jgi:tetratricopeptide (TPR) repeat protein
MGHLSYLAGRYDESIENYRRGAELDPSFLQTYLGLGQAYEAKGAAPAAFAAYQKWARLAGISPPNVAALERAYAEKGLTGYWSKRLDLEKEEEAETGDVWSFEMASLLARAGLKEEALVSLGRAYAERNDRLVWLAVDPAFTPLRSDGRFRALLQRLGLPRGQ